PYVFSNGHGIARFTEWFADLADLELVDWEAVYARMWRDTIDDMDRQRRKQAEFLVQRVCDWSLISGVGVRSDAAKTRVEEIFSGFDASMTRRVDVRSDWYY
ncbi:MAG: DUF4433 domain-containing protein, partial [Bryobacteraceae bacterium]